MAEQGDINQNIKDAEYAATSFKGDAVIYVYNYNYNYKKLEATSINSEEASTEDNPSCPYRGLFNFSPNDSEYFFGRDVFIEELFKATKNRNFISVLGASGSGKSSVVLAGLVPKLEHEGNWKFTHFRPSSGDDPFYALAEALVPLYRSELDSTDRMTQADKLAKSLREGKLSLAKVFSNIQRKYPNHKVLLIADQFEELYTQYSDHSDLKFRRSFLDCLLASFQSSNSGASSSTVLVATMRADFLANALSYRPFADMLQNADIKLGAMSQKELIEVIEKPAQKLGVTFEAGLVERILNDVKDEPGNLPLLEFALTELWKKRTGKQLTHEAYEAIGQVKGALADYAENKYKNLTAEEKEQARRIFIQLVRPGEGTEDTRRRANRSELGEENWNLITRKNGLAYDRLVVTNRNDTEQETVEVVHEALIQNWGQLREWMETDRKFRIWQEQLRAAMHQWENTKRDDGSLLRGTTLAEAEDWQGKRIEELSEIEQDFIQKSLSLRDREKKQQDRRQRNIVLGLTGGFLSALILASVASLGWWIAEKRQINTFIKASESLFLADKKLDSLIEALKAGIAVQKLPFVDADTKLLSRIALLQAVYGVREFNRLEKHSDAVTSVVFSPNGQTIASASLDKTIKLWSIDGSVIATIKGHDEFVTDVAFSPDGQFIATASLDNTVKLWDSNGTLLKSFQHDSIVYRVNFSPNGKMLGLAIDNATAELWDLDGNVIAVLKGHGDTDAPSTSVTRVSFSPDGKTIATASLDNTVKIWHSDGTLLKNLKGHDNWVMDVSFSPDGSKLVSSSTDHDIKIWTVDGALIDTLEGHQGGVYRVVFDPSGNKIASASHDGTIRIWRNECSSIFCYRLNEIYRGHTGPVSSVNFSPNGEILASASLDNTIKLWNLNGQNKVKLPGQLNMSGKISFSPDSQSLLVADEKNSPRLWGVDGTLLHTLQDSPINKDDFGTRINGGDFNPDGTMIASVKCQREQENIELWSREGTLLKTLTDGDCPQDIKFSPDGHILAVSGSAGIKLLSLDGNLLNTFKNKQKENEVNRNSNRMFEGYDNVDFTSDGQMVIAANGRFIDIWQLDGTLVTTIDGHLNFINDISISPDGKTIASASADETAKIWDLEGNLLATFPHDGNTIVNAVNFSPDSKLVTSISDLRGGSPSVIKVWQRNGNLLAELHENNSSAAFNGGLSFSPNSQILAASMEDKVILWNTDLDNLLAKGCSWVHDYLNNNGRLCKNGKIVRAWN